MKNNTQNVKKRIMVSAPKSGSGKTYVTILLIRALMEKGYRVCSAKCGPDYIDTMYHRKVLGIETLNLDYFLVDKNERLHSLLSENVESAKADICVIEGAMGFYDGVGGVTTKASAYEISKVCDTPVIMVMDVKGASVSIAAVIKGLKEYRSNRIEGIFLNRCSVSFYDRLKGLIEEECGVKVVGYLPELKNMTMPSRHLGLLSPEEIDDFESWIKQAQEEFSRYTNIEEIIRIASGAGELCAVQSVDTSFNIGVNALQESGENQITDKFRIAIARDEAFSFYYKENEKFLERCGAELVYFSPIRDEKLPEDIDGLILGGGYPEMYAARLSQNIHMLEDIKAKVELRLPFIAECGGFLYLQQNLVDINNTSYKMVGFFEGDGIPKGKLTRFGYAELCFKTAGCFGESGTTVRCHEFHHWDCTDNGAAAIAHKQYGRDYECMKYSDYYAAGFPHFYFEANPEAFKCWVNKCIQYRDEKG